MKAIILVEELRKVFKLSKHHRGAFATIRNLLAPESHFIKAVDGISFQIQPGEIVGYLGPNGAGKSTTVKMLTGLLIPTSGKLEVNGYLPWRDRKSYVHHIGAVFGQRTTLWWDLPVIESFDLLRYLYSVPKDVFRKNLDEFRALLDLDEFINVPVRSLSLGQRMRADLCAALLHNPELVFLDEPTIGLDIVAKERIRQFILQINQERGTTVLLTTHDLSDVEKLCKRVMIIDRGQLLFDGDLEVLKKRYGEKRRLMVDFAEVYPQIEIFDAEVISNEGRRVVFQFERDKISASELIGRIVAKYRVQDLQVFEPNLEDTIRKIYSEGFSVSKSMG